MGPLPKCALAQLEQFFQKPEFLSNVEKQGLRGYKDTLQTLVNRFPPHELMALVARTLEKTSFTPDNALLWGEDSENKLNRWKIAIDENYTYSLKLIAYLNNL